LSKITFAQYGYLKPLTLDITIKCNTRLIYVAFAVPSAFRKIQTTWT
jgi:hypothetical protein